MTSVIELKCWIFGRVIRRHNAAGIAKRDLCQFNTRVVPVL